ncbi:D-3-phosphoglycerate dehydrogenase [Thalassobacillus cyri]|uniref:D-3-phosphoglycerate dehydrogenase n=1 Tax=Thalassobacillus cyri TaxID=571932 RepID=A0A1H4DUX8_9BACI|nr:C-terminal binding protein [Thalassobacillus cyri]SEA76396.1 D-3-phosphoglycerate dehydrogenase [Thalassobacillus cyri]
MKIVITDYEYDTLQQEQEVLTEAGLEYVALQCKTEEEVIEACRDADGIITQYAPFTEKVINNLEKCKVIARYGIGVDSIDVNAASEKGITVCNVTDYCLDEVSDHAMALLLSAARKVTLLNNHVKNNDWNFNLGKPIHRLRGQVLGLVGFGNIPQRLAEKAKAFGLQIITYDPYIDETAAGEKGARLVDFDSLLAEADFVSVHAPLTKATQHMMNEEAFQKMKPTAYLINTARGGLVDEAALEGAVKNKEIAGAAIDVMEQEPPVTDHSLLAYEEMIITPHVAWYSEASEAELKRKTAQNVADVLTGKKPAYSVNR